MNTTNKVLNKFFNHLTLGELLPLPKIIFDSNNLMAGNNCNGVDNNMANEYNNCVIITIGESCGKFNNTTVLILSPKVKYPKLPTIIIITAMVRMTWPKTRGKLFDESLIPE